MPPEEAKPKEKATPAPKKAPKAGVFDPEQSYGVVRGHQKAVYFQDGVYYDIHENKVTI